MMKKFLVLFITGVIISAGALAETRIANDPSRVGVGARLLGMGKAHLGLTDDLATIFIDPAGLAGVENWQVTSMSGKFLNEYSYLNFGAAYPSEYGVFGLGFVGSGIGFTSPLATTEVLDGIRIIPSTTEGQSYNFSDNVILFSWGRELSLLRQYLDWEFLDDLKAGATLKFFSLDLSGPGIVGGQGSGNELDLGLHYRPNRMFKIGLAIQNALPIGLGGKIHWNSGTDEPLSATIKTGLSFKLVGKEGWQRFGEHDLTFNLDYDQFPSRPSMPSLWHTGLEWAPIPYIDLRLGFDQDIVGTGTAGQIKATDNFTAGVGLYYADFRFDYAYHQYNALPENDTHYFSLTYGVSRIKPEAGPAFFIQPPDKTILFRDTVGFSGQVKSRRLNALKLNNTAVGLQENRFTASRSLKPGKNAFLFTGLDGDNILETQKIRILSLLKFKDVPDNYWAAVPISILAMEKVITGYPDGTFKPDGNITRAEMCTLLIKTLTDEVIAMTEEPATVSLEASAGVSLEVVSEQIALDFKDVDPRHWAAPYIKRAAEMEVVKGYPDDTFRPAGNITRAEGVAIIARFFKLKSSRMIESPYDDVPGRHWAAPEVSAAKEAGVLQYLKQGPFLPKKYLSRAEVAEMLSKCGDLAIKVNDLLDWEKGY